MGPEVDKLGAALVVRYIIKPKSSSSHMKEYEKKFFPNSINCKLHISAGPDHKFGVIVDSAFPLSILYMVS